MLQQCSTDESSLLLFRRSVGRTLDNIEGMEQFFQFLVLDVGTDEISIILQKLLQGYLVLMKKCFLHMNGHLNKKRLDMILVPRFLHMFPQQPRQLSVGDPVFPAVVDNDGNLRLYLLHGCSLSDIGEGDHSRLIVKIHENAQRL